MTDQVLDVAGARLALDVREGTGPVVVALHGLSSSRASEDASGFFGWGAVAEAGRTLVRYDARGHGRSTGRPEPADYRWSALAQDLLALLDVVSPDAPVDAVGVSMGTGTLLHAATLAPQRFRRLALVIAPTAWGTRAAQAGTYRDAADVVAAQGRDVLERALAAAPPVPLLAAGGWWPLPGPDIADPLLPAVFRGAAESDLPAAELLARLPHEVLLRPWADDPGHPVSTSERLAELLPHAALRVTRTPAQLRALGGDVAAFLA